MEHLFISSKLLADEASKFPSLLQHVEQHGGHVHVLSLTHPVLEDVCGIAALLRYSVEYIDAEADGSNENKRRNANESPPPVVATRSLSRWTPVGNDLSLCNDLSAEAIDEVAFLSSMFEVDRKMRFCADDRFLLLVDSSRNAASDWLVLDIRLHPEYPHDGVLPQIGVPFGSINGLAPDKESFDSMCCTQLHAEPGEPLLYELYTLAREWIDGEGARGLGPLGADDGAAAAAQCNALTQAIAHVC